MRTSVIIPTFNSSETIKLSLKSAINQTLQPYEIIVIDDCSNDNTKEIGRGDPDSIHIDKSTDR